MDLKENPRVHADIKKERRHEGEERKCLSADECQLMTVEATADFETHILQPPKILNSCGNHQPRLKPLGEMLGKCREEYSTGLKISPHRASINSQ